MIVKVEGLVFKLGRIGIDKKAQKMLRFDVFGKKVKIF